MTSKERFRAVCSHQNPDRFPMDYLAAPAIDEQLMNHFKASNQDEMLDALGIDFYFLPFRDISQNESFLPYYKGPKLEMTETERVCPFGIRWKRGAYQSKFAVDEAVSGPLKNATFPRDILEHNWPKVEWFDLEPLHEICEQHSDKVIVGGAWTGILGDSYRMHGFENFLLNMAMKPDLVKTLVNRMTDFYYELNEKIFTELGDKIDIWFWGNDYGSQNGLIFSKDMFETFFLDNIKKLNSLAHQYDIKVMMHSCGSIYSILPQLIQAGVDIIDPVQTTADQMEPEKLKDSFGQNLVFHGAVDTQNILRQGTPEQVGKHVQEILSALGRSGGYIFAPCNLIQADVPLENVLTMYDIARNYKPS